MFSYVQYSNVCCSLEMLQVCMTILTMSSTRLMTTLMTTFLKRLRMVISIWTQAMTPLHDHSQKFIACLWPFTRQGTVRLNDTILLVLIDIKTAKNVSGIQLCKCHVDKIELSQMLFASPKWLVCHPLAFQQLAVQYSGGGDNVLNQACHCHRKLCYCWLRCSYSLTQAAETACLSFAYRSIDDWTIAWKRAVGGKAWSWGRCQ